MLSSRSGIVESDNRGSIVLDFCGRLIEEDEVLVASDTVRCLVMKSH